MFKETMNRRAFLETTAQGAILAAATTIFGTSSVSGQPKATMKIFVCTKCGHLEFGQAPVSCPVCHAPQEAFQQNDALFTETEAKSANLSIGHTPEISVIKISKLIGERPTKEVVVRIGKKLHPMEAAHFIQWIDCYVDDRYISRILLTPGANPAATFYPQTSGAKVRIVEHCNLHGHWQAEAML